VLEFFCTRGDSIWNTTDADLCELAVAQLCDRLSFIDRKNVIGSFAFRAPRAYPAYTLDYHENLKIIKDHLAGIRNLQIIGRGGTFRYNNSDHSIEMGMLAARNLLGESHSLDLVNSAFEYLEEKVTT
jgi:protoporphyrinogen oxidase